MNSTRAIHQHGQAFYDSLNEQKKDDIHDLNTDSLINRLAMLSTTAERAIATMEDELSKGLLLSGKTFNVAIIGGGIGGCLAAIELAELAKKIKHNNTPLLNITILEKGPELARGTAQLTPGRLGLGFHYVDEKTALIYLQHTTNFVRRYPDCFIAGYLSANSPLRHGRYIVMKNAGINNYHPKPLETLKVYEKIQDQYRELIAKDRDKYPDDKVKIWGEPEDFLKITYIAEDQQELRDYLAERQGKTLINVTAVYDKKSNGYSTGNPPTDANLQDVAFIVETAEELLDWEKCRSKILRELNQLREHGLKENNYSIEWVTNAEVTQLNYNEQKDCIEVACKNGNSYLADYPVVCAWERAEALLRPLGIPVPEKTTNRLKSIISVTLPVEMYETPSMFFCMGPYAMFSNLGNGRGKVTYAVKTNMGNADADGPLSAEIEQYLNGTASKEQTQRIGQEILAGATHFVPGLAQATVEEVAFGIVRTRGTIEEVSIYNPKGKIGERDYGWVRLYKVPNSNSNVIIIQNDCMKITYSDANGKDIRYLITDNIYNRMKKPNANHAAYDVNADSPIKTIVDIRNNPDMLVRLGKKRFSKIRALMKQLDIEMQPQLTTSTAMSSKDHLQSFSDLGSKTSSPAKAKQQVSKVKSSYKEKSKYPSQAFLDKDPIPQSLSQDNCYVKKQEKSSTANALSILSGQPEKRLEHAIKKDMKSISSQKAHDLFVSCHFSGKEPSASLESSPPLRQRSLSVSSVNTTVTSPLDASFSGAGNGGAKEVSRCRP